MWKRIVSISVGMLVVCSMAFPTYALAHPPGLSRQVGPNVYAAATPKEWQDDMRRGQVESRSYGASIKYVGEFTRTSNTIDLSKYAPGEVYFGCIGDIDRVTRKTKVIVLSYTTLIKTKEYPTPTVKDKLMDFYGDLYFFAVTKWTMKHS